MLEVTIIKAAAVWKDCPIDLPTNLHQPAAVP